MSASDAPATATPAAACCTHRGLAAFEPKGELKMHEYPAYPFTAHDVRIRITHCGLCHSDIHLIDNDWGVSQYPLVTGHEAVGIVEEVGSEVLNLKPGARVAIGWMRKTCMQCDFCREGKYNLCKKMVVTPIQGGGGFADGIVVDARQAHPLPESMPSEFAGPLLCAGITMWSPLFRYTRPTSRVGIVGIGGLGHIGIKIAAAFGCEVYAISTSDSKREDALQMGATHFVNSSRAEDMAAIEDTLDLVLVTVNAPMDFKVFLPTMRTDGVMCFVGAPPSALPIMPVELLPKRLNICASNNGTSTEIRDMLRFCALHKIYPIIEKFPAAQANDAIAKLRANQVRYRAVLEF